MQIGGPRRTRARKRRDWPVITGLLLLAAVPSLAGAVRVGEMAGGAARTAENARFIDMPAPVLIHIFGAVIFAVLGAFQFAPRLRARHRRWHRIAGRIVLPAGLAAAVSGLWMTLFYPLPPTDGGAVLGVLRLVAGTVMFTSLLLGFAAILRRDFTAHRAWMMRGYAIGMGAGTQVFTVLPWILFLGTPSASIRTLLMAAGWVINIVVAEYIIRTRP
jgi:uncharacterized membrane protein